MKSPFELENKVYGADAVETKAVMRWCSTATIGPLGFGIELFRDCMHSLHNQSMDPNDSRGLILGFHAKGIEQILAIRALADSGSIGAVFGQVRTLFETHLYQAYILEDDTETRIKDYRLSCARETATWAKRMIALGDSSATMSQIANTLGDISQRLGGKKAWTGKTIEQLAGDLGMGKLYVSVYRAACGNTHATDIDPSYNPIRIQLIQSRAIQTQPLFVSNYGLFSATDATALVFYLHFVPYVFFGNTASYLNVTLGQEKEAIFKVCRAVLSDTRITITSSIDDIKKAYPELSMAG